MNAYIKAFDTALNLANQSAHLAISEGAHSGSGLSGEALEMVHEAIMLIEKARRQAKFDAAKPGK